MITAFKQPVPCSYRTPQVVAASAFGATFFHGIQAAANKCFDRNLGYHIYGHVIIELKTIDPATNEPIYIVTSVTDADPGEAGRLVFGDKIGLSIVSQGTEGKIQSPDEAATILEEPSELGVKASRMRFLLSSESAAAMLEHYRHFVEAGVYKRYVLTAYPLHGDGAGCSSLAVSFLDVGGLLTPDMVRAWKVSVNAPEHLFGDLRAGRKVPVWRLVAYFVSHCRWPETDYRTVRFYDPLLMYNYAARLAERSEKDQRDCDRKLAEYLSIPTATFDARTCVPRRIVSGVPGYVGDIRDPTSYAP
jgi:hypothetical protein